MNRKSKDDILKFNNFIKKYSKTGYISRNTKKNIDTILKTDNFIEIFNKIERSINFLEIFKEDIQEFYELWDEIVRDEYEVDIDEISTLMRIRPRIGEKHPGINTGSFDIKIEDEEDKNVLFIIKNIMSNIFDYKDRIELDDKEDKSKWIKNKGFRSYQLNIINRNSGKINCSFSPLIKLRINYNIDDETLWKIYDYDLKKFLKNFDDYEGKIKSVLDFFLKNNFGESVKYQLIVPRSAYQDIQIIFDI